jgi:hypothetical protein
MENYVARLSFNLLCGSDEEADDCPFHFQKSVEREM